MSDQTTSLDWIRRNKLERIKSIIIDQWFWSIALVVFFAFLVIFLVLPLLSILAKIFTIQSEQATGIALIAQTLIDPSILQMSLNSIYVGLTVMLLVIPAAYIVAFTITRTQFPCPTIIKNIGLLPLFAPSLLSGISLVYLAGNQGLLKPLLNGTLYGFWGIVVGEAFYTFPHALVILITSLSIADGRLYEAALTMNANACKRFLTITLPGTRYGIFSASCVVFTLTVTDFGIPKVIGGDFNVLAIEAYKAVVGQQNFSLGATIGLLLLVPTILTFSIDRYLRRRQQHLGGKTKTYHPKKHLLRDTVFGSITLVTLSIILLIIGIAVWASFIKFWPYNLSLTLNSYDFDNMDGGGWLSWRNSITLATLTAAIGAFMIFTGAWVIEKLPAHQRYQLYIKKTLALLVLLPMAIPGIVLGLGYIFFFNAPANPWSFLYGSMTLMVACTIIHFYTSAHLTATTALTALDPEYESVSLSLKVPFLKSFIAITLGMNIQVILDIARYLFVSAMTTVSALVFIYSPNTVLAAVAVLNMDDAGKIGGAAAMSTLILATSLVVNLLLIAVGRYFHKRSLRWR